MEYDTLTATNKATGTWWLKTFLSQSIQPVRVVQSI